MVYIILVFTRAQREGMWDLHLHSFWDLYLDMFSYFSGKIVSCNPREVLKKFKQGNFFGKRNGSKFNQISSEKKSFELLNGKGAIRGGEIVGITKTLITIEQMGSVL